MTTDRTWIHQELPERVPSAAARRLGCPCEECAALYREYMRDYRARKQHERQEADGTAHLHTHKGQPSKRTARRWGCTHTTCLTRAGLYLDDKGVVRVTATGEVDATFGATAAAA